jgi:ABC-type glycerol-3-phosphate transport system substrate-binding protein
MSVLLLRAAWPAGDRCSWVETLLPTLTSAAGVSIELFDRLPPPEIARRVMSGEWQYDLIGCLSDYTTDLAPHLIALEPLLSSAIREDLEEPALDLCRAESVLVQVPLAIATRLLFYRSDLLDDPRERAWFAEASEGRELRVPESWGELAATAQHFTRTGALFGFSFAGEERALARLFGEITTTVGGSFLEPDGTPRFYSRAGEWALGLLHDLHHRWQATPPDALALSEEESAAQFRLGRAAFTCDGAASGRLLKDPTFSAVAGWHGVTLLPAGPDARRAAWCSCVTGGIPRSSRDPDGAARLLEQLAAVSGQESTAAEGFLPASRAAAAELRTRLFEGTLAHRRASLAEFTFRHARLTAPAIAGYLSLESELGLCLQPAVAGAEPVETALRRAFEVASRAIETAGC